MNLSDLRKRFDPSQPRDERGRWADTGRAGVIAAGAVAGGLAAGVGVDRAIARRRIDAFRDVMAAGRDVRAVDERNASRVARHDRAAAGIGEHLKTFRRDTQDASIAEAMGRAYARLHTGTKGVSQQAEVKARNTLAGLARKWDQDFPGIAERYLRRNARLAEGELSQHMLQHAEPFWPDGPGEPVWASTDAQGEAAIRDKVAAKQIDLRRLQDNVKAPKTVARKGGIHIPKTAVYGRTQTMPPRAMWRNRTTVEQLIADEPERFAVEGIRSVEDVERLAVRVPRKHLRRVMEDIGLPVPRIIRPRVEQIVRNAVQYVSPHTERIDGFPTEAGRKKLSDAIRRDVELRGYLWRAAEGERASARRARAVEAIEPKVSAALRRLSMLRGRNRLAAVAGAGILGALGLGGAAALATHRMDKLAKFDPGQQRDEDGRWSTGAKIGAAIGGVAALGALALGARHGLRVYQARPLAAALRFTAKTGKNSSEIPVKRLGRVQFHEGKGTSGLSHIRNRRGADGMSPKQVDRLMNKVPMALRHGKLKSQTKHKGTQERAIVEHGKTRVVLNRALGREDRSWRIVTAYPMDKLAKAAPEDQEDAVYRAGAEVEDSLASRLAITFGEWTRIAGDRLMERGAALRSTLIAGIERALRPLDAAANGGAGAPVPAIATDETGEPRMLSISLETGSGRVNDYARTYRLKLAGELADEQLATIQSVLNDATLQGQATEVTARLLRQTIGLTPIQAGHVISYRRQLAALDPNALNRALRDARYDRTIQRAIESNAPLTDDQLNRMVDAYQRRYLAFRANTIARTEGLRAANNGHVQAMKDYLDSNPNFTVIKTWVATHDRRTRPDHLAMDGQQQVGLYTPFEAPSGDRMMWPHDESAPLKQVVRCFHPDSIIQGRVVSAVRAQYRGPMRKIVTRQGTHLTVTAQHPILTPKGFVRADSLRNGDNLIRYVGGNDRCESASLFRPGANDEYYRPSRIEDVFNSFFYECGVVSTKLVSDDLYGDMKFGCGDIDIVSPNRSLLIDLQASGREGGRDFIFSTPSVRQSLGSGVGDLQYSLQRLGLSSRRSMRRSDLANDKSGIVLDGHPLQFLRFGPASDIDAATIEVSGEPGAADTALVRNLLEGYPALVAVDEISEVLDFHYDGPVFDVETTQGWVVAEGIFSSNCRCTIAFTLVPRTAAAHGGITLAAE